MVLETRTFFLFYLMKIATKGRSSWPITFLENWVNETQTQACNTSRWCTRWSSSFTPLLWAHSDISPV
jgi:hypothetical protein